jgi:hypothetical protein
MHLIGGTIPQGLMQALPIIKLEVTPNPVLCLGNTRIVMQVNFLLFHRTPEPFDNYIIRRSPTPIHADYVKKSCETMKHSCFILKQSKPFYVALLLWLNLNDPRLELLFLQEKIAAYSLL